MMADSSSARNPIDTTLSRPGPTCFSSGTIFLPSAVSSPCIPSRRGTEKPQMSASRRPTTSPRWARATARLTVTDDFPTPPLPDDTARTRAVAGMSVDRARSSCALRRARSMSALRSAASISPMTTSTRRTPGRLPTRDSTSCLELGPQGAARHGQGDFHLDPPVGVDAHRPDHAQIDDVVAELGVDHPQQARRAPSPRLEARKAQALHRSYRSPGPQRSELGPMTWSLGRFVDGLG